MEETMTDYETMQAEAERISTRIANAPVEPWLKTEALSDLERLLVVARGVIQTLSEAMEPGVEFPTVGEKANTMSELSHPGPVDYSWHRMQVIESLARAGVHPLQLLSTAREIEEWVRNG